MKKPLLRSSLNTGITFGIVHIFAVLIGFNAMLGTILANIAGVRQSGTVPAPVFLAFYCIFIGIWAGSSAARKADPQAPRQRVLAGLAAGGALGFVSLVINLLLALLLAKQVDPRLYIPSLSKEFMSATLFDLPSLVGVAVNALVFLGSGALGGLLSNLGRLTALKQLTCRISNAFRRILDRVRLLGDGRNRMLWKFVPLILLAAALVLLPLNWGSYWNYVIGSVGLYVILGLGLNLIVGLSGQLVLGYIAFFAIGAYSVALTNAAVPHNLMWGFWPGLGIGILLSALAGILLGLPLMRLRGDYLAIVTLGFGEIIRILLKSDLLTDFTGGPRGIQSIQVPKIFGRDFGDVEFTYLIILAVLFSIFVYVRLANSRTGRAWLSIREDETVAKATGVNTNNSKLLALALGAALAGLAGGIYAARNQFTGPNEHSLMASINVLSLIIVGGMGSVPGTILGAFALKGLPEILREFANYRLLAFGALLVVMMLSRPEGLLPSRKPTLELPEEKLKADDLEGGCDD